MRHAAPRPLRRASLAALLALAALTAPRALPAAAAPAPRAAASPPGTTAPRPGATPRFGESVDVVETSVLAALPAGVKRAPAAGEWLVRENGADRPVERVEPVADEPWEVQVWVDGPLCRQESLERTLLGLAFQAERLVAFGPVRVVVADPEPRTVVPPTREPKALVEALAHLAPQQLCTHQPDALLWKARGFATPPRIVAGRPLISTPASPTPEGAAAAMDELHTLIAARAATLTRSTGSCPAAACTLLYVADGYPIELDQSLPPSVRSVATPALRAELQTTTEQLALRLALGRWLLVALPFAPPPPPDEPSEKDQPLPKDLRPGPAPFPDRGDYGPPPIAVFRGGQSRTAPPPRSYDVYTEPELAPLRRLAEATAGAILRVPEQLPDALAALRRRQWVWYRTTRFAPEEARALQVLAGRPPQSALAPAWVGVPPKK